MRALALALVIWCLPPAVRAAEPADTPDPVALAGVLRDLLIQYAPTPLVTSKHDWDKQKNVLIGLKWHRDGKLGLLKPEPQRDLRNDGHWHRTTVTADDLDKTLQIRLTEFATPEPGTLTGTADLGLNVRLRFEQQLWKSGVRLYSGETRGRCRVSTTLRWEATSRTEAKPGSLIPEVVVRYRVTSATLRYDDLVIEHVLGVGGDAAKFLGETGHQLLTRVKPSLERDALAKANAAIVKAGDSKDIRLGLDRLMAGNKRK